MFDRYDLRDDGRDDTREGGRDLSRGSRSGGGDPQDVRDRDRADVFTRDLDLPRGRDREFVRDRDRVYELDGDESRDLATVGRTCASRVRTDRTPERQVPGRRRADPHAAVRRGRACRRAHRPRARSARGQPIHPAR